VEVKVGPFKTQFFQGVPKPKAGPTGAAEGPAEETVVVAPIVVEEPPKPTASPMPPAAVVKTEEIKVTPVIPVVPVIPVETPKTEEKPVIVATPVRPEIRAEKSPYKKSKKGKTFAPPSEVQDLKSYLKPSKGPTVQVIVAWKERILNTYNFKGTKAVRVNAGGENDIALPDGLVPKGYPIIDLSGGLRVNTTADMGVEMVSANGQLGIEDLKRAGKSAAAGAGFATRVEQSEVLCVSFLVGYLNL